MWFLLWGVAAAAATASAAAAAVVLRRVQSLVFRFYNTIAVTRGASTAVYSSTVLLLLQLLLAVFQTL